MEFTIVKNPQYNRWGTINMEVYFPSLGEMVPFTASPDDSESHGRELYSQAKEGKFGPIADYVMPEGLLEDEARQIRDNGLENLDRLVSNPLRWASFTPEKQEELSTYRQDLLDVPQQEGFPLDIVWPIWPLIE